jgi:hypothetical protein
MTDGLAGISSFVTPLEMDPLHSNVIWTASNQVFRSIDAANEWKPASDMFTAALYGDEDSETVSSIGVSPLDSNLVVAGTEYREDQNNVGHGGWVHVSKVAGSGTEQTHWSRSRPRIGWVSSISFDPHNADVVYVTYSSFNSITERGHIFRSKNKADAPWEALDGPCVHMDSSAEPCNSDPSSIPDIPAHTLVVDPSNSNRLWVGTDIGIFTSLDAGGTWKQENSGFRVPVSKLMIDAQRKFLYAFTHGRGVWKVAIQ